MEIFVAKNNTYQPKQSQQLWRDGSSKPCERMLQCSRGIRTVKTLTLCFVVLTTLAVMPAAVAATKYPIVIEDSAGNTIVIDKPVERIVALTSDATEVIRAIGAADRVVGVPKYVVQDEAYFPELSRLPNVGSCFSPDIEKIIELEPDIVIAYVKWPTPDKLDEHLEGTGIKVVRFDFYKPLNMSEEVEKLGLILEREDEAAELVGWYEAKMDEIESVVSGIPDEERVRVYIEMYTDYKACGLGSGGHDMLTLAGGRNIVVEAGITDTYPEVDPEFVIREDPDVIVKMVSGRTPHGYGEEDPTPMKEYREDIMGRPGWDEIKAVQEGRVYMLSGRFYSVYPVGVAYLTTWFYPEEVAGIVKPRSWHREYLERFHNLGYSGVFTYPLLFGDANIDDVVSIRDAQWIAKYDVGLVDEGDIDVAAADVNGDRRVTITDALLVAKYIVGLIEEFPVEA
ncbi:MAG: ABC-type Fe3+-hydroxamate transport system [Candidatus Alkanophagales archaeon MCA70_species_1]|nr:ABC-type Fe3+-hydroxamate transport system [Candidatus Alkanophaga volatiphilum]